MARHSSTYRNGDSGMGVNMELENSTVQPTPHDNRYDEQELCDYCLNRYECTLAIYQCEYFEEE